MLEDRRGCQKSTIIVDFLDSQYFTNHFWRPKEAYNFGAVYQVGTVVIVVRWSNPTGLSWVLDSSTIE